MSARATYPEGVPCFVDTLAADLDAARRFYGGLFDWTFAGPAPMAGDLPGEYWVARVGGADVAGLGSMARGATPGWNTHVAVASVDDTTARARAAGASVLLEPCDAPPAGRMAVVTDPAGASLCLWQAGSRHGAARVNEPSAWAMSLLTTPDVAGAERFYGEVFGWQAEPFGAGGGRPAVWLWRLPGYIGGEPAQPVPRDVVAAMTAGDGETARWNVDFWIADATRAAARAPELGGRVLAEPFPDPPFVRAVLAAPDGATFSISELRPPAE